MTAGLLLPSSSTHPLIAHNFAEGIKSYLRLRQHSSPLTLVSGAIGFGTDRVVIEKEANRLILEHQADVLVIFADYPVVSCLFPLIKALNKLLIVVNHAAKYPPSWEAQPNVIHHHLGNVLNCWLTGRQAAKETAAAAVVSSYYDGGYAISHALSQSFMDKEGKIVFNFVGHQYKDQFNTQPLVNFLAQQPQADALLAILSGELVPEFYDQLKAQLSNRKLRLYASPVLLEESLVGEQQMGNITVSGYTGWLQDLPHPENRIFCEAFRGDTFREPDSVAVLGWDTGLILKTIDEISAGGRINGSTITQHPALRHLQGAKEEMHLHAHTQHYISPLYYLSDSASGKTTVDHTLALEDVAGAFDEMIKQDIQGVFSEWLNTYLCS